MADTNRSGRPSASLADFISDGLESILVEWESFARKISPDPEMDELALRDHAADILEAIVLDMRTAQDEDRRFAKSHGDNNGDQSHLIRMAAEVHASTRMDSGYDVLELVAEYRALRASVLRLWQATAPPAGAAELEAVNRFNESIDQSLTMALQRFTSLVDRSRHIFLAILGHDLRNPLAAISMSAQIMSLYGNLDEKSAAMVTDIRTSVQAMEQIINDLLDFTGGRLGASMPITKADCELGSLCREVVDETAAAFPKCSIGFCPSEHEIHGRWDRSRIRQMISNLLANACQHGQAPIDLELSAGVADAEIVVRSGGKAIASGLLSTIFDPLYRSSSEVEANRRRGSLGLGLYIVREVVKGHGGTIDVRSSEEEGTVFTISLPRRAGT